MRKTLIVMASIAALLGVPRAKADVEVRVINSAGGGDTGWMVCAGNVMVGASCTFSGAVGNYILTSDIATGVDGDHPLFDMTYSARTTKANAGTIVIEAMADGFETSPVTFTYIANGNSTIRTTHNLVSGVGGDTNNICPPGVNGCTPGSLDQNIFSLDFPTPPVGYGSFNPVATAVGNTTTPYSLGLSFSIVNPTSSGSASGDLAIDFVPEPASIALFGGVLLFAMNALRRKLRPSS
jgi:hypothetical protein